MQRIPSAVDIVVMGAGFAGASTAAALARAGVKRGLLLEREFLPGMHSSGRNAAISRQVESDPILCQLAVEGVRRLRMKRVDGRPVLHQSGGIYLLQEDGAGCARQWLTQLEQHDVSCQLLSAPEARTLFLFLQAFNFCCALSCPTDGIVDIHGLLTGLLAEAQQGGFRLVTNCEVESIVVEGGAVHGVRTPFCQIEARIVVDARGAWAGTGIKAVTAALTPLRRHLFVSSEAGLIPRHAPRIWDLDAGYYVRPESGGLLLCPCDESEHPPALPPVDFDAAVLLADKLLKYAPALADLKLRGGWACLRTFAPDRRPVLGWDPEIRGLFYTAGLGGFGVTTSLAIGELAAALICGGAVDWIDVSSFSMGRVALRAAAHHGQEVS